MECEEDSLEATEDSPVVIPTMPAVNPALRELTNISRTQQGQTTQQGKPGALGEGVEGSCELRVGRSVGCVGESGNRVGES